MARIENTPISSIITQASCGSRTNIWGVDAAHTIYQYTGSGTTWTQIPGALKQVSVASDGSVWGVDANGTVYHYNGNTAWIQIPTTIAAGGPSIPFTQVMVGSSQNVWGLDTQGHSYGYSSHDNGTGIFWTDWSYPLAQSLSFAADGSFLFIDLQGITQLY